MRDMPYAKHENQYQLCRSKRIEDILPPTSLSDSKITTSCPAFSAASEIAKPEIPAPTTLFSFKKFNGLRCRLQYLYLF